MKWSSAWTKVHSFILIVTQLFSLFICCLKWCNEDKWESFRWFERIMLVAGQHSAAVFGLARGFQFKSETSITNYPTQNSIHLPEWLGNSNNLQFHARYFAKGTLAIVVMSKICKGGRKYIQCTCFSKWQISLIYNSWHFVGLLILD